MIRTCMPLCCASMLVLSLVSGVATADEIGDELATIARTGPEGAGSEGARAASTKLASRGADILPRLLAAMETENPVAANWVRSAYEVIAERELTRPNRQFPVNDLKSFVRDSKHVGRVRRLALSLCDQLDPGFSKALIPKLLQDPEFRQDAVETALSAGQQALENGDSETARAEFRQAFEHSRDSSQTVRAAGKLAGLGENVDIAEHLGLIVDWWLIGPFDAPQFSGFAREFPPEHGIDLKAEYTGQEGRSLHWVRHRTADTLGLLNLVQALAPAKEAVGYAFTELISSRDQAAQLRCGADDNCTVWLNGQKVFGREQWLNGIRLDRFVTPVQLRSGPNQLLVKVCQGPQHKDPQVANNWSLQLRFCDENGSGIKLRSALPKISGAAQ
jgi:hypothetical protein